MSGRYFVIEELEFSINARERSSASFGDSKLRVLSCGGRMCGGRGGKVLSAMFN